ncbi:hypothetical protein M427DRAFT_371363 [Gonapodya prolifera JEL478]|uniref:Uncharacterized protein n=1 Tax=Gonapodya prolifera (strain JEL478) TaxID=1344416 RepID=A0A139A9I3_GONPJ|nr:hypothetical protein M427DRAFT_371363 [Gonapodya prolifera JEL478]|eukprot:KXS13407.1 hypothetical protein M427DRAFT_371363 [Gonapodya prolifera JEL478]
MAFSMGARAHRSLRTKVAVFLAGLALGVVQLGVFSDAANADAIIQVTSSSNFCLIMPPGPNLIISDHEYDALSYCLPGGTITSTGGRRIPSGFITAAHYVRTPNNEFAQVSGTYNPAPFGLIPSDQGGQYDSNGPGCGALGCPVGAICQGYSTFIEILGGGEFCVRCCNDNKYCPVDRDTEGCQAVMGGDYGGGFTNGNVGLPSSGTNLPSTDGTPITPPPPPPSTPPPPPPSTPPPPPPSTPPPPPPSSGSPCGSTDYCIDTSTLPTVVSAAAGTYQVTVKIWTATAKDMLVELHQSVSLAIVSNYAFNSIAASTSNAYTTYTFSLTWPALGNPPYNWFVWISPPGAGWAGQIWNQVGGEFVEGERNGLAPIVVGLVLAS